MTTLNLQVSASSDDARQNASVMDLTATTVVVNSADDRAGLRFLNVTIPPGSTVDTAALQLYSLDTVQDDPDDNIYCEDVDDATTFTSSANNISSRTLTTASVAWSATGVGTGWVTSPDIAAPIQEYVDRPGRVSGNDLNVIFDHQGPPDFRWRAYDGDTSLAAKLDITYTPNKRSPTRQISRRTPIRQLRI